MVNQSALVGPFPLGQFISSSAGNWAIPNIQNIPKHSHSCCQWIGLRQNLNRKPMGFWPSNRSGFPVKIFPSSNSMMLASAGNWAIPIYTQLYPTSQLAQPHAFLTEDLLQMVSWRSESSRHFFAMRSALPWSSRGMMETSGEPGDPGCLGTQK